METLGKQPRRKFLSRLLSCAAGAAALFLAPRRARAEAKKKRSLGDRPDFISPH